MNTRWSLVGSIAVLGAVLVAGEANAQTTVTYGRITAVRQVNIQNEGATAAGTLVGGAAAGSRLAGAAGSSTGFQYTVLIGGTNTINITTEQAGMRVGDCVSVERGQFNNIRLVDDARCNAPANTPVPANARAEADACVAAKDQLLAATTDADFALAERRMRLLCGD